MDELRKRTIIPLNLRKFYVHESVLIDGKIRSVGAVFVGHRDQCQQYINERRGR